MSMYKMLMRQEPLSRNSDPMSSHRGADRITKSGKLEGQCKLVYEALKRFPLHTARELSHESGLDYIIIQKRLTVLERRGLAVRRGERRCKVSTTGINVTQWEANG